MKMEPKNKKKQTENIETLEDFDEPALDSDLLEGYVHTNDSSWDDDSYGGSNGYY